MKRITTKLCGLLCLLASLFWGQPASAEPYLSVREGLPCSSCHVNPTGGGLRSTFGDIYSQTQMPQQQLDMGAPGLWLGNVGDRFRIGGNYRYDFTYNNVPHEKNTDSFGIDDFRLYGAASLIQDRLILYIDELIAPGGTQNREAYGLLSLFDQRVYVKAGQLYLPFGYRLQDDEAFVQQVSGINYTTPDGGIEAGTQHGPWAGQLALTNGNGGSPSDNNQGKQVTANFVYLKPGWRLGVSYADNEATMDRRQMAALYAGLRTGPVAWLAEGVYVADSSVAPKVDDYAGLLEADWAFWRGNNLKITAEFVDPNVHVDHDQRNRFSVVWEYTPIQFVQTRLGLRDYNGIPQDDLENERQAFLELHLFF